MATEITYEVKTHEESYTEPEITLRRELEAHLPESLRNYTTKEDLKGLKEYRATADTFHPENHFYVFNSEGELQGFTHLWPNYFGEENENVGETASITLPFVRGENKAVEKTLYQASVKKAKSLGIKTLRIEASSIHTELLDRLDEYGFNYSELATLRSQICIDDLKLHEVDGFEIMEFNEDEHGEAVLDAYEALGIDRQQIKNQFKMIRDTLGERVLSWKVAYQGEKLVGQGIAFLRSSEGTLASLNVVTRGIGVDDESYKEVIYAIYGSHLPAMKKANVEDLELHILQSVLDVRPLYEELGFEFVQRDYYTLDL